MSYSNIHLCIQARMSSSRFPGKVIVDIEGLPLVVFLYNRLKKTFPTLPIVILTSNDKSDDALIDVLDFYKIPFFRGSLQNVLFRFNEYCQGLGENIDYIGRICADSPFLNTEILRKVIELRDPSYDILTTRYYENDILKSTASKGNNFDLIKKDSLLKIFEEDDTLTDEDKEHIIFPFLRKKVLNINVSDIITTNDDMAIDTLSDLERIRSNK